jgi:hypothetical protein
MARIPVYEQRLAPNTLGVTPRANPAQVYGGMGQALQNAGQMIGNIAQNLNRLMQFLAGELIPEVRATT